MSGAIHMGFDASRPEFCDGLRFIRHFLGERWVLQFERKKERIILAVYFTSLAFVVYASVKASGGNHLKFVL